MKGAKSCPKCQTVTGPRAFNCVCGYGFIVKGVKQADIVPIDKSVARVGAVVNVADTRKELKHKEVDWKTLVKGDVVRVSAGPVWPRSVEEGGDIPTGYAGIFKVRSIDDHGILAYPVKAKTETGACYIYCGIEKKHKSGTLMRPHKIMKVHRKVKE